MALPETYTIEKEKLQLGDIIKRCEEIARRNADGKRYFVGRETIRGRLRCGVRTWDALTAKVMSHKERAKAHPWRGKKGTPDNLPGDRLYEPEDYVGPDEDVEKYR